MKIKKNFNKLKKWLDLNIGWIFINGRKREWWESYLKEKYEKGV